MERTGSLRARSVIGVYDAAFEVAASSPKIVAVSFLGGAPIAVLSVLLIYAAAEGAAVPGGMGVLTTVCALATLFRFIPSAAVARIVLDGLEGRDTSASAALSEALRKAPLLIAAGATASWLAALSIPMLLLPVLFAGGAWLGGPLVMERACPPWSTITKGRRLLGDRATAAGGLTLIWIAGILLLAFNLALMIGIFSTLARSLLDLELGYLGVLLSAANPAYVPALMALAFLLLEPIRSASLALLYADARVRREGMDLRTEATSLAAELQASQSKGRRATVLLLLLFALIPGRGLAVPGSASTSSHSTGEKLEALPLDSSPQAAKTLVSEETLRLELRELIDAGERLSGGEERAFDRLIRRLESEIDGGDLETAARRLKRARAEIGPPPRRNRENLEDARRSAKEILERPEFRRLERPHRRQLELPESSLWERFWSWLDRRLRRQGSKSPSSSGGADLTNISRLLWGGALVLFLVLVVFLLARALGSRQTIGDDVSGSEASSPSEGAFEPGPLGLDPLSRSPGDWLAEADRLSKAGAHREALRAAYLALLSQLHRARAIEYTPSKSNLEHAMAFRGSEDDRGVMLQLTRAFDRAWYGQRATGPTEYERVKAAALSLFGEDGVEESGGRSLA